MDEIYEIGQQANYRVGEMGSVKCTKFLMDEMYEIGHFLQSLNMNAAEFVLP